MSQPPAPLVDELLVELDELLVEVVELDVVVPVSSSPEQPQAATVPNKPSANIVPIHFISPYLSNKSDPQRFQYTIIDLSATRRDAKVRPVAVTVWQLPALPPTKGPQRSQSPAPLTPAAHSCNGEMQM